MGISQINKTDKHIEEIEAYEQKLIEDLTVDEALIYENIVANL
jgi:hypothetical protein